MWRGPSERRTAGVLVPAAEGQSLAVWRWRLSEPHPVARLRPPVCSEGARPHRERGPRGQTPPGSSASSTAGLPRTGPAVCTPAPSFFLSLPRLAATDELPLLWRLPCKRPLLSAAGQHPAPHVAGSQPLCQRCWDPHLLNTAWPRETRPAPGCPPQRGHR